MIEKYAKYEDVKRLLSADCVIFGYEKEQLKLLLFKRIIEPAQGEWSLIGGWIKEHESAEDAALRVLTFITGLKDNVHKSILKNQPTWQPAINQIEIADSR